MRGAHTVQLQGAQEHWAHQFCPQLPHCAGDTLDVPRIVTANKMVISTEETCVIGLPETMVGKVMDVAGRGMGFYQIQFIFG